MAIIKCPECGHEISSEATSCPNCGRPFEANHGRDEKEGTSLRGGSIIGLIGGASFVAFMVAISTGSLSNSTSQGSGGVDITFQSATSVVLGLSGFIATAIVTVFFIAGLVLNKRLKRRGAVTLSVCALVLSVIGLLGMVFYYGMLALCGGWLFIWEPVLEVIGAGKMLASASRRNE